MSSGRPWRVTLHDDDVNPLCVVVYLVKSLFGIDDARARRTAVLVDRHGRVDLAEFAHRDEAEEWVVQLQRHGLHASLRHA